MTERALKVPYALDAQGRVVSPLAAQRGAVYTCLECAERLDLRRSRLERPHFAHRPDARRACSGESAEHLAAKLLLKAQLEEELEAHGNIVWHVPCPGTSRATCREHATLRQDAKVTGWDAVALEVPHGPYRFDVAVKYRDCVVYGFEVFFKHQVPEDKAKALRVPWLELFAEDILEYRPRIPLKAYKMPGTKSRCPPCEALQRQLEQRSASDQQRAVVQAAFIAEQKRVQNAWREVLKVSKAKGR